MPLPRLPHGYEQRRRPLDAPIGSAEHSIAFVAVALGLAAGADDMKPSTILPLIGILITGSIAMTTGPSTAATRIKFADFCISETCQAESV